MKYFFNVTVFIHYIKSHASFVLFNPVSKFSLNSFQSISSNVVVFFKIKNVLYKPSMDGVLREVNERTQGRGVKMYDQDQREWLLSQLLFADDAALVPESGRCSSV